MTKKEILLEALGIRDKEILGYQINIDNFERAISKISELFPGDERMASFAAELESRLDSEKFEQQKSLILHSVIKDQLNEMDQEL